MRKGKIRPGTFIERVGSRCAELFNADVDLELIAWSEGKLVPHFILTLKGDEDK